MLTLISLNGLKTMKLVAELKPLWQQSAAVAAIPEGLPAIVTVVLAIGMQNLVRQKRSCVNFPLLKLSVQRTLFVVDRNSTKTMTTKFYYDGLLEGVEDIDKVEGNLYPSFATVCYVTIQSTKKMANIEHRNY